jgi:hypothetical protein
MGIMFLYKLFLFYYIYLFSHNVFILKYIAETIKFSVEVILQGDLVKNEEFEVFLGKFGGF